MEAQSYGLIQGSILALGLRDWDEESYKKSWSQHVHCPRWDSWPAPPTYMSQALQFKSSCQCNWDKETNTLYVCVAYDELHFIKCLSMLKSKFGLCHNFNGCEKHGLEFVLQVVIRSLVLCNWVLLELFSSFNIKWMYTMHCLYCEGKNVALLLNCPKNTHLHLFHLYVCSVSEILLVLLTSVNFRTYNK